MIYWRPGTRPDRALRKFFLRWKTRNSKASSKTKQERWILYCSALAARIAGNCLRNFQRSRLSLMRVLVTGGAGFLGSHLCDALLAESHSVICVDNLLTGNQDNIAHLKNEPRF